jgi:glycine/D-amino acid oxidase-like deaminating enzyme
MEDWDIVILGAGMIGASAAKYVVETLVKAQQHARVLLIGPRNNDTSTARGQHFDVARIVRRVDATSPFYAVVAQESMKRFRDIEEKSGVEFYTPCSLVWVEDDPDALAKIAQGMDKCAAWRSDSTEEDPRAYVETFTDFAEVERRFGNMFSLQHLALNVAQGRTPCALVERHAGTIHPDRFVEAQLKLCALAAEGSRGSVTFRHEEDVAVSVKPDEDGYVVTTNRHGDGIRCRKVAVCVGSLCTLYDLFPPSIPKDVSRPIREQVSLIEVDVPDPSVLEHFPAIISKCGPPERHFYFLPPRRYEQFGGGYFAKLGRWDVPRGTSFTTLSEACAWVDSSDTEKATSEICEKNIIDIFECASLQLKSPERRQTKSLRCLWDETHDRFPRVGTVDGRGWFAVFGTNGRCAKNADELGRLLCRAMFGDATAADSELLSFCRIPR